MWLISPARRPTQLQYTSGWEGPWIRGGGWNIDHQRHRCNISLWKAYWKMRRGLSSCTSSPLLPQKPSFISLTPTTFSKLCYIFVLQMSRLQGNRFYVTTLLLFHNEPIHGRTTYQPDSTTFLQPRHIPTQGYNITQSSAPDDGHMVARNMLSNY